METKAEYVTDDPLGDLMDDIESAGSERALASEWGTGSAQSDGQQAKAALREYVDALVKGGITAQIADLLEQVAALEIVIDSKEQVIEAMQARIDELQAELASETRWAKQYHDQWRAALSDLREMQE